MKSLWLLLVIFFTIVGFINIIFGFMLQKPNSIILGAIVVALGLFSILTRKN